MKISTMLNREDFYTINEKTLQCYFSSVHGCDCRIVTTKPRSNSDLFIFPHLNAIVSKLASKQVRDYIYTEFQISGNVIRRIFIKIYIWTCFSFPVLFADRGLEISGCDISYNEILVYPCNRKIRIFDFENDIVDVVVKEDFPTASIQNEIETRLKISEEFILPILSFDSKRYREKIINGVPLARINDKTKYRKYLNQSLSCLDILVEKNRKNIKLRNYIGILKKEITQQLNQVNLLNDTFRQLYIETILDKISSQCLSYDGSITISLSHGDFQHGNIWVENKTNKVFIIDWESTKIRSIWYDRFIIYNGTRCDDNLINMYNCNDSFIKSLATHVNKEIIINVIILEDINYKLSEILGLPHNYGIVDLNNYFTKLFNAIMTDRM